MKIPSKFPPGLGKILLRRFAANVLKEKGFKVEEQTGQGIRPGARLIATPPEGPPIKIAVRTGRERSIGVSRLTSGAFRTLEGVDLVLAVVPDEKNSNDVAVFAFEAKTLRVWYGRALKALDRAGRTPDLDVPIFIPLDEQPRKNVGHSVSGLKKAAVWSVFTEAKKLMELHISESVETFVDRVKREFAERNEVDVSKVSVEFRILA
jgi:hypothetical protein